MIESTIQKPGTLLQVKPVTLLLFNTPREQRLITKEHIRSNTQLQRYFSDKTF